TTFNQVPDLAQAQLDIRSINKAEQDRLTKKILALCDKYHAATKTFILLPPVVHDLQNPYMQTLISVIADITGVTDQPGVVSHAGSEAIFFARQHIPCAVFYPTGGGHHSAEEWIDENVIDQFPSIIQGYLDRVAKMPTPAVDAKPALV
ncbi:MAG TPA: M20/M25/M40 family metallo-hydrolase, partial [Candidatus Saccharimonadales bacterium]|nr:M20/M25/M40 family metallo-hydrolase [Candidatus Saccharimonadales bacterium]